MKPIKGFKALLGFLTVIPVKTEEDSILTAAGYMHLFPLIGALIGFLAGIVGWLLLHILPSLVVGMLTLGFTLLITGLHHTDGLLDFGDGLMVHGSHENKIQAMRDSQTGVGGFILGVTVTLTSALCISQVTFNIIIPALIVAEVSGKLSMFIQAWAGRSASLGLNTYFIDTLHGRYRITRLLSALALSFGISFLAFRFTGLLSVTAGIITSFIILSIANHQFNGVTGDVMGATNDLSRMATLITVLSLVG